MDTRHEYLKDKAERIRLLSLEMTTRAGSGHPTTAMSSAEILSVLYFDQMRYDPHHPESLEGDDFVISKGHGAPGLYATMHEAGILEDVDVMTLREAASPVEGHPVPRLPGIRVATGSLGQGLSVGLGLAHAMKLDGYDNGRVFVLLGDGEMAEGNVWEAINLAPHMKLGNVIAIVDVNRLGQANPTVYEWDIDAYSNRIAAFDWHVQSVDGHSTEELASALEAARDDSRPSMILARTVKGKGVDFLENSEDRHGKAVSDEELEKARAQIEPRLKEVDYTPPNRVSLSPMPSFPEAVVDVEVDPGFKKDTMVATRTAYGTALAKIGAKDSRIVVIDGDVKGSSRTKFFFSEVPDRAIEGYIAEQNMVGMALGLQARGFRPHVASFAAFLTRAHDQFRMASYSRARMTVAGSHTGVSIGEDGPSQMGLEDIAMMRSLFGSVVLSPSDAVSAQKLTALLNGFDGIGYIRTIRGKTPVIYDDSITFLIGGCKMLRSSPQDRCMIVATGVTVSEALEAAATLARENVSVGVIDAYSLKPLDERAMRRAASTVPMMLTVEDHYPEGGLGEAVSAAVRGAAPVYHLAVTQMPHSGPSSALMAEQGIDAGGIVRRVKDLMRSV
ncbi:MAG: transketolase [Spirochaetota bacterium]